MDPQGSISYGQYLPLAEAAKEYGVTRDYLRFLIFKKRIRGLKMGRNWFVTKEWLNVYFQQKPPGNVNEEKTDTALE